MPALIDIRDLRVTARVETGSEVEIVKGVSFSVEPGHVLGLIGESGSGKTTVALATMGYARYGCRISSGSVRIGENEVTALSETELRALRGHRVAYIAQSAAAAFNPARTILAQVIEPALIHGTASASQARQKAIELFCTLAVPDPETIGARYPHQVSGGQLQRLMAAMALITDPEVVIFDEPTTALDVTTQIEVLKAFKAAIRGRNTTGIYVTHDLAVIAQIADTITVLRDGAVQETGETRAIIANPNHDYTRSLLAAAEPAARPSGLPEGPGETLLSVSGVTAGYGGIGPGGEPRLLVLRDISLSIRRGAALGVIGESGCGKSTLARTIAGLTPLAKGAVALAGVPLAPSLRRRTRDQLRRIQLVFQSADTALNPTIPVEAIIGRPLTFYFGLKGAARAERVRQLIDLTQLPSSILNRLPGDLSGGQKQRVSLARALAAEPELLLCDEVTAALDTVVAAAILDLLSELRRELGLTYMFISHDLKTVRAICDDVMVLYAGRLAELMPATELGTARHHPYSHLLFSSVPELEPGWLERPRSALQAGAKVDFATFQSSRGCAFFPRCPSRIAGTCDRETPPVKAPRPRSRIACHLDL